MILTSTRARPGAVAGDAGTTPTFDAVYVAHHRWALRLATALTGDPLAAEDIVADVFVKLIRRLERGSVAQPQAYLRTAILNQHNSVLRRRVLERARAALRSGDGRGARIAADDHADRDQVARALRHLTPRQRQVLVLRYYEDLGVAETAAILGLAEGTVKTTAHRALGRLEDLLEDMR